MHQNALSIKCLGELRQIGTCALANAIERFEVRPRNEGFIVGTARCQFPQLPPVVGYALTGRIRSSMPPVHGAWYYERSEWWQYIESMPEPRILVVEDVDRVPGTGALFGEIHSRIFQALGGVAYVTNGAVRDLPEVESLGFQLFAGSLSVSHAYAHVVDFGSPIHIGGLRILSGDLLHGDRHGVLSIPTHVACDLPPMVEKLKLEEQELAQLCQDKNFSVEKLTARLKQ
jgi:4-hydroxy-4-methyl-2-oxoglutarate aldolase